VNDRSSRPTVSIITAAYNADRFVADTLRSVQAQSFPHWEHLIVDDGSTDGTADVVEKFRAHDNRFQLIRARKIGLSAARNLALSHARGAHFALLDSDDMWMPHYLTDQVAFLERHPEVDIVSANAINLGGAFDGQPLLPRKIGGIYQLSLMDMIEDEEAVCIMSMFRRKVVEGIGNFDVTMCGSEDYDFWLRAVSAGFRLAVNGTPLCLYRRRPDSVSAEEAPMLVAVGRSLQKLREHLRASGSPEVVAIDRKLAGLEARRLLNVAKRALLDRDFPTASANFRTLERHSRAAKHRLLSLVAGWWPSGLFWAYSSKRQLRFLRKQYLSFDKGRSH
jgi:glycosyltransferase involved in cell wall biosynthesis